MLGCNKAFVCFAALCAREQNLLLLLLVRNSFFVDFVIYLRFVTNALQRNFHTYIHTRMLLIIYSTVTFASLLEKTAHNFSPCVRGIVSL